MNIFELIAILPGTHHTAPDERLQAVRSHGYTAMLLRTKAKTVVLPQSRKKALQHAAVRQQLLEACMPLGAVFAVRPNLTLTLSETERLICANQTCLAQLALRFVNTVQYQITVEWDAGSVLTRFRDDPEIVPLFQAGCISQNRLTTALKALADRLSERMLDELSNMSDDLAFLPRTPDMLINCAALVASDKSQGLDRAVEAIDQIWTEGLRIRQIGPAPAASFALLDPVIITSHQIASAKQRLGIGNATNVDAARRKALLAAPHSAADIRHDSAILRAAHLLGKPEASFHLCDVLSEDQTSPTNTLQEAV